MLLASEMQEVAAELADEFGTLITMTRKGSSGTYNPAAGKRAATPPLTQDFKAIPESKGRWLDGVVKGEVKLTIPNLGLTFAPKAGDDFTHGGVGYKVMDKGVVPTEVEGVIVVFEVYGVSA